MGCNKCKKQFLGPVGAKDYSGFDRSKWPKRTEEEHRWQMKRLQLCETKCERDRLEALFGTRYTVFSKLPYFQTITMTIIDPMHNLFLGTSKKIISLWKEIGYLSQENLLLIQERVDCAICPSDMGKLPKKIFDLHFEGFTADELKTWTLIFSLYALHGILPKEHLECWRSFVLSCRLICTHVVSNNNLIVADLLLQKFCKSFEHLYGKNRVTPNIHLHGHIVDCILDFGPVYNFWLFSFERLV